MAGPSALYAAVDLVRMPSLASVMRERPLPSQVRTLIQIAAGDTDVIKGCAQELGENAAFVRMAAKFYIRQVLWAEGADSYRILGANSDASEQDLAENFRWFMKWVHPDSGGEARNRTAPAVRVLAAWETLKTKNRRAQYDARRMRKVKRRRLHRAEKISRRRIPWVMRSTEETPNIE